MSCLPINTQQFDFYTSRNTFMAQVESFSDNLFSLWGFSCDSSSSPVMVKNRGEFQFPFQWNESVASSQKETQSEEDDYIADLAEKISHAMLDDDDDDDDTIDVKVNSKRWAAEDTTPWPSDAAKNLYSQFSGSEIWSGSDTWSTSSRSSISSSQNSPQIYSPPSTPLSPENDPWDLLYTPTAMEVKTKRPNELDASTQEQESRVQKHANLAIWRENNLMVPSSQLLIPAWGHASCMNFNSFPALPSCHEDQTTPFEHALQQSSSFATKSASPMIAGTQPRMPKQTSVSSWERQNRPVFQQHMNGCNKSYKGGSRQKASPCQSPPLQPTAGSSLRAVFLGSNVAGRESAGTGVFLPQPIGTAKDHNRKPACSTVLLPPHIIQALNLNVEDVHSPLLRPVAAYKYSTAIQMESTSYSSGCHTGRGVRNMSDSMQKSVYSSPSLQQIYYETALPTEWTY